MASGIKNQVCLALNIYSQPWLEKCLTTQRAPFKHEHDSSHITMMIANWRLLYVKAQLDSIVFHYVPIKINFLLGSHTRLWYQLPAINIIASQQPNKPDYHCKAQQSGWHRLRVWFTQRWHSIWRCTQKVENSIFRVFALEVVCIQLPRVVRFASLFALCTGNVVSTPHADRAPLVSQPAKCSPYRKVRYF